MKNSPFFLELLILLAIAGLVSALCFSIFVKENLKANVDNQVKNEVFNK